MKDTVQAAQRGEKSHRRGPPPLHPRVKAVTAQAAELLGVTYLHNSQVDDPFQRRDGLPLARRLWEAHGGGSRLVVVRLHGHYRLDRAEDVLRLQADGKAMLRRISGESFAWGAVEVSEQFTEYQLTEDGLDVVGILHGTGAHLAAVISADVPLPEGVQLADTPKGVHPWETVAATVYDVAHWIRYHRKGYDQRMNSKLLDFAEGSFEPPCPVKLALAAHDNDRVRHGLWLMWWEERRQTRSKTAKGKKVKGKRPPNFPPMQFSVNDPKQKQAGQRRPDHRYGKEQERSAPNVPSTSLPNQTHETCEERSDSLPKPKAEAHQIDLGSRTRMLTRLLGPTTPVEKMNRAMRRAQVWRGRRCGGTRGRHGAPGAVRPAVGTWNRIWGRLKWGGFAPPSFGGWAPAPALPRGAWQSGLHGEAEGPGSVRAAP